jgi:hypothetical protein
MNVVRSVSASKGEAAPETGRAGTCASGERGVWANATVSYAPVIKYDEIPTIHWSRRHF